MHDAREIPGSKGIQVLALGRQRLAAAEASRGEPLIVPGVALLRGRVRVESVDGGRCIKGREPHEVSHLCSQ